MGTLGLLVLLFLAARANSAKLPSPAPGVPAASPGSPAAQAAEQHAQAADQLHAQAALQNAAAKVPPPFPQAVPAGLPPFPSSGWVPAVPTPAAVTVRAVQLLPILWQSGAGTRKTEMTAGQWITFLATAMQGGKKGVTAWKLRNPGGGANA